jgi:HlyD family secretion protein
VVSRASLTATLSVTGSVRSNQSANIAWQAGGKVGEVKVAVGQTVKKGDVLVSLDPTSLPQNLIQAQSDLLRAQNDLKNLTDQAATNKANAEKALAQAQKDLDDAQTKQVWNSNKTHADAITIQKAEADYYLALDRVKTAQENYDNNASLDVDAPARAQAQSALAQAQSAARQAKWLLDYYRSKPTAIEVAQTDANVKVALAKLADAQRQYDLVKNGPAEKDITIANNSITMAQASINLTRLTAPFNGTITSLSAKPGDVVSAGTPVLRMDDLSKLFIDSQISEVDINRIKAGQPVSITFDAISGKTYEGAVTEVGTVGNSSSGAVNFTVTTQMSSPDGQVKTAMTAGATLTVAKLDNVLVVPVRAIRTVSGKRVVFTPAGQSALTPVIVELGSTGSDAMVEITGGDLKEGDTIVTNPPATTTTFGPGGGGGAAPAGGGGAPGQ